MFLKIGELKKALKAALKMSGLTVGNADGFYVVAAAEWGVYVDQNYASNKFKAAIMELVGDLPEPEECLHYTIGEIGLSWNSEEFPPDPYEEWKRAKDGAVATPIVLSSWRHEYIVFQRKSNLQYLTAPSSLTVNMLSAKELEEGERMPERPNVSEDTLYFKNEAMIYWVKACSPGERVLKVLFPRMEGISFFETNWLKGETRQEEGAGAERENDGAVDMQLPY